MLVPELILLPGQIIQFVLSRSDSRFDIGELSQEFLPLRYFILPIGIVVHRISLVFVGLGLQAIELYLELVDVASHILELGFGPPHLVLLLLELSNQLRIVILGLEQSLVEPGVIGLAIPGGPLQSLELVDVLVEEIGECITIILELLPLLLERLDVVAEIPVLVVLAFVLALEIAVVIDDGLDFVGPGIGHPLESGVLPKCLLDLHRHPLDLNPQGIDFLPQLDDAVLVDIGLDPE